MIPVLPVPKRIHAATRLPDLFFPIVRIRVTDAASAAQCRIRSSIIFNRRICSFEDTSCVTILFRSLVVINALLVWVRDFAKKVHFSVDFRRSVSLLAKSTTHMWRHAALEFRWASRASNFGKPYMNITVVAGHPYSFAALPFTTYRTLHTPTKPIASIPTERVLMP